MTRFPVAHKALFLDIKGTHTDIVLSNHDDCIMVMVTQIGSMGTILHASKEESVSTDRTFNVSVIFGKRDEPLLVACARQLIEHISNSSSRPLLLSLGLKEHSLETCKEIVAVVIDNCIW